MSLPERGIEAREGLEFDKFIETPSGEVAVKISNPDGSSVGGSVIKSSNLTSNVSASATSVTLLSTNEDRVGVTIYNDSVANLYINWGLTASATSFSYLLVGGATWECPVNMVDSSQISGIWSSATGTARITEAVEV